MNRLDKMIRRERRKRYKKIKKLFKARDMASKHIKGNIKVSMLVHNVYISYYPNEDFYISTSNLAKMIFHHRHKILNRPPVRPVKKKR